MTTVRLMDGSFFAALRDQGFDANQHKLWTGAANKLCPEKVFSAYNCFLEAGVDVITTNTYHSLIPLIKQYYPDSTVDDFNEPAVSLLREALKEENVKLDRPITMLGSIGCYGAALRDGSEYRGNYVDEEGIYQKMKNFYIDEISKLERYGLDQLIIETVPALLEVKAILEVIASTPSTFVISFTCKDGEHLRHGERLSDAVKLAVEQPNIAGVGVNCTAASHVSSLLRSISGLTDDRQVFVYPNTNTGYRDDINMDKLSDDAMAMMFQEWISLGATVIGGCCGVSPELTMKMRQVLDSL